MSSNSVQTLVEKISVLSVLELAELTKALEEKFGVSAAMPMAAAMPAAGAPAEAKKEEEKTEYKVELLESGSDKIKVIKALRKVKKDLGLTEAKAMAEGAPVVIGDAVAKADAMAMKEELEAAGAKVKLS